MGFCPNCGTAIETTENFCPNCGYPLSAKARKMVMGVTQKMLLVAPQNDADSTTPPTTDEHGIVDGHYEPNTATRRSSQKNRNLDMNDDPYMQNAPADGSSRTQQETLPNGRFGGTNTTAAPQGNQHTAEIPKVTTPPQPLNNYMTRSVYEQLPQNGYDSQANSTKDYGNLDNRSNYDDPYQNSASMPKNGAPSNTTTKPKLDPDPMGYGNFDQAPQNSYGATNYNSTGNYGNNEPTYDNSYTDSYGAQANYQNSNVATTSRSGQSADYSNYQNNADPYGATGMDHNYGNQAYATEPMGYGADQTNQSNQASSDTSGYDQEEDYGRGQSTSNDDDLSFFQKIGILDWVTTGLSIILILTTFVGGFISSGSFGTAGTTSSTLYKTMTLGGTNFKTMMILLLFLLIIGPLLQIVFSIWKIHAAYIIKLAAAVVSILAYIAVFGILISKGIVAASGLQNFQFGISAIVAIVLLIANFIIAVVDFVKY